MQSNFWAGSKNLDRHKTFWDLKKDKAIMEIDRSYFQEIKFIYSEKATKFCKISTLLLWPSQNI